MKNIAAMLCFTFLITACGSSSPKQEEAPQAQEAPKVAVNYFENMDGCFLLYNMKTDTFDKVIGGERCQKQFPACSTFKVPLAVIAFDSGALKDEDQILKWNGVKDSRPEANRDHDARSWMRDSIVWFSQRITKKLGLVTVQSYLDKFSYGNKDMSAGITKAWLVAPSAKASALKISAYEQVEFMKKLWKLELPATARSQRLTQEITYLETSPNGFKMNGKTGSNFHDKSHKVHLGWFISHLQKGDQEYITVANFSDLGPTNAKGYGGMRVREITKKILADEGLW